MLNRTLNLPKSMKASSPSPPPPPPSRLQFNSTSFTIEYSMFINCSDYL